MSQVPGEALEVDTMGRSALVMVSTVALALPLVTRAWKEEQSLADTFILVLGRDTEDTEDGQLAVLTCQIVVTLVWLVKLVCTQTV